MKYYSIKYNLVFLIMVFTLLSAIANPSFACRYNVRETGFVYLAQKPYQLVVFYSNEQKGNDLETIQQQAKNHFYESNIEPVYVNVNSANEFPELLALQAKETISLPWTLLKSADGQILKLPLKEEGVPLEKSLGKVFNNISFSKQRNEIINNCIDNYGVVLILEGTDADANKQAHIVAQQAIEHVKSKMDLMPKKINAPPVVVSIKNNHSDEILNWSLGLENKSFEKPKVFVIYGRGRWIGPVLENELLTKKHLSELLIIVGADCECGIDREWMRGTMIPIKWDKEKRKKVAENLGFDPENPLIKKEVRNILRMGEIFGSIAQNDTTIPEIETIFESPELVKINSETKNSSVWRITIFAFCGILFVIMFTAIILLKKNKS